jgi:lipopolysaccharide biosynthesis glycosyltransferase
VSNLAIAYAITESYAKQFMAATLSLFASAHAGTTYDVYVMIYRPSKPLETLLDKHVAEHGKGSTLTILAISEEDYQRIPIISGWLKEASFRMLLPRLLPQVERLLYLDADTVVMADLGHLESIDLSQKIFAGVCEQDYQLTGGLERLVHIAQLDGKAEDLLLRQAILQHRYVNSGVLLLNLHYWRNHQLSERSLCLTQLPFSLGMLPDQDILNYLALSMGDHSIAYLPPTYNCINLYYPKHMQDNDIFGMKSYERLTYHLRLQSVVDTALDAQHIQILHMVSWAPWQTYHANSPFYDLYKPFADTVGLTLVDKKQAMLGQFRAALHTYHKSLSDVKKKQQLKNLYWIGFTTPLALYVGCRLLALLLRGIFS